VSNQEDKMMKILRALYLAPLLAMIGLPAMAHHDHGRNGIQQRMDRQELRIERGVRNGGLTRHEAKQLYKQRKQFRKLQRKLRGDGVLTRSERRRLQNRLDKNSQWIRKLNHNDQRRGYGRHHRHYPRGCTFCDHDRYTRHERDVDRGYTFRRYIYGADYDG